MRPIRGAGEDAAAGGVATQAEDLPAAEVRVLDQLFEDDQVRANGLVHTVEHDRVGAVKLLGSLFKIDGAATAPQRAVPALGEHPEEVLRTRLGYSAERLAE